MIFIWGDRGYPAIGFEYKTASGRYMVAELEANLFWVFFLFYKMQLHCCFYISARKKATAMVFIWGDRGYPAVRFEYKTASERYLVVEL